MDALAATRKGARTVLSYSYCLMYWRPVRAKTGQSSRRRSSPGVYSRYSANSTLKPWKGLRCWPLIAPSTSRRERKVRSEICAITSGSEYFGDSGIGGSLADRHVAEQLLDDRVARLARGLRVVV